MLKSILENYYGEEILILSDEFNDAVIGVEESSMRLIYSVKKCLEILMKDMSEEDALEHFSYNISGGDVGEKTPIWCHDNFEN